jgi:hypothetical protein
MNSGALMPFLSVTWMVVKYLLFVIVTMDALEIFAVAYQQF